MLTHLLYHTLWLLSRGFSKFLLKIFRGRPTDTYSPFHRGTPDLKGFVLSLLTVFIIPHFAGSVKGFSKSLLKIFEFLYLRGRIGRRPASRVCERYHAHRVGTLCPSPLDTYYYSTFILKVKREFEILIEKILTVG